MKLNHATRDAIAFLVFAILIIIGLRAIFPSASVESTNKKHAIAELGYCNASDAKPCVVSFSIDAQGNMLINLIAPRAAYPEFYVTIASPYADNHYECARLKELPENILCTGLQMNPGEPLHFSLFAVDDQRLLAEGTFNIIGLMLATPNIELASASTEGITATAAPDIINLFNKPTLVPTSATFVIPIAKVTSYPNPSYPNNYP